MNTRAPVINSEATSVRPGVGVPPREHRRDEDRPGRRQPSQVYPAQNPVRIEDRLTTWGRRSLVTGRTGRRRCNLRWVDLRRAMAFCYDLDDLVGRLFPSASG